MKKFTIISISLLCGFVFNLNAQKFMRLEIPFYSETLQENRMVDIYLPSVYYVNNEQQFATIYYLHEEDEDQTDGFFPAQKYFNYRMDTLEYPPAIFVVPDGSCSPFLGSCFMNSELYGSYEDYFIQDVISFVESNFRAMSDKNFRLITGESTGGFAAAYFATKYPEKFRACFPNFAFLAWPDTVLNAWKDLCYNENNSYEFNYNAGKYTKTFFTFCGAFSPNLNNGTNQIDIPFDNNGDWVSSTLDKWYEFDLSRRVKDLVNHGPFDWYLACGTTDPYPTYTSYETFMDSLDAYNIGYTTNFNPGGHSHNTLAWINGMRWMDSIIYHSFETIGIPMFFEPTFGITVFPNPTSDQVNLNYSLSSAGRIDISLYDNIGQKLATLQVERQPPGEHSFRFMLSEYPAGIYFVRLQVGDEIVTKKIVKIARQ